MKTVFVPVIAAMVVSLAAALSTDSAAPTLDPSSITITPGPGMPSLESLNLTVADLLSTAADFLNSDSRLVDRSLQTRRVICNLSSGSNDNYLAPMASALACQLYLIQLNTHNCEAHTASSFCSISVAGSATEVWGSTAVNGYASSYCRDVAYAVGQVRGQCVVHTISGKEVVRGSEFARGNGNLLVHLSGNLTITS